MTTTLPTDGDNWAFPNSAPAPIPSLPPRDQARALKHALVMVDKTARSRQDEANIVFCRAACTLYDSLKRAVGEFDPEISEIDRIRIRLERGWNPPIQA